MTLDIHAKRKLEKQERGTIYPVLLIIHVVLAVILVVSLINSNAEWFGQLFENYGILLNPDVPENALIIETENLQLVAIVDTIALFGLTFVVGFICWYLYSLSRVWTWHLSAYRTWLTVSVGLVMYPIIIQSNLAIPGDIIGLESIHWSVQFVLAIINLVVMLLFVHQKFYPDYKPQDFTTTKGLIRLSRDLRTIRVIMQIIFAFLVFLLLRIFWTSIYASLEANNTLPNFDFLFKRVGFLISPAPNWYTPEGDFGDAFVVGVINTLQVVSVGLVLATILGVLTGIFLLSNNWLIRTITRTLVEILRNTPLLVQLIFWYFVVWLIILPTLTASGLLKLPEESVMVVKLRFFPYLFALIGLIYYVWRSVSPPRLLNGAFTAILVIEIIFYFIGDNYISIIGVAVLGGVLIFLSMREDLIPSAWAGFTQGIGIIALVQLVGQIMLDGMGTIGLIENSKLVYGEVSPLLFVGANVVAIPRILPTVNFFWFGAAILLGLVAAIALYIYLGQIIDATGRNIPRTLYALLLVIAFGFVGWFISAQPIAETMEIEIDDQIVTLAQAREESLLDEAQLLRYQSAPIIVELPALNRFGTRVQSGISLAPRYMALLIGLVIYTAAFIGEIVRAGIQSVPHGQIEAARAVGLNTGQTLRMIVLPQALRVIIPPLGNQYLNLSKNSSLATAIGFADTYALGTTIMNQSGQSVTGFVIVLVIYLILSLIISLFMNFVNSRFQLVTR